MFFGLLVPKQFSIPHGSRPVRVVKEVISQIKHSPGKQTAVPEGFALESRQPLISKKEDRYEKLRPSGCSDAALVRGGNLSRGVKGKAVWCRYLLITQAESFICPAQCFLWRRQAAKQLPAQQRAWISKEEPGQGLWDISTV